VRTRDVGGVHMLEIYHDRVRESVQASLSAAESKLVHSGLLTALECGGTSDPDFLHALALGAGEREAALRYGHLAAERANASLAFERAAEVYKTCIELADAAEAPSLWNHLALALGRCGRGVQAAEAYLEAAKHVSTQEAVALMQMAATHLLRSGRFEQGEELVNKVLAEVEIKVPKSERGVIAAIAWERACLKMRGMSYRPRNADEVPAELLARHDTFDNLGPSMSSTDTLTATLFQFRGLRCALNAGEPVRLVGALCRAAYSAAIAGTPRAARASDALLARAEAIAREAGIQAQEVTISTRALASFFLGRHGDVLEYSDAALQTLRNSPDADARGNYYRRHAVASMRTGALYALGRYHQLISELTDLLREARDTDNRALLLNLAFVQSLAEEIRDQALTSRPRLERQQSELPKNRLGILHVLHLRAVMQTACATRDYAWANQYLEAGWADYERSVFDRGGWLATGIRSNRSRFLLNQYVTLGADPSCLSRARADLAWFARRRIRVAEKRIAARLAHIAGDDDKAIVRLREVCAERDAARPVAEWLLDRSALGALIGGDEGRALCDAAGRCLGELGVVNPRGLLRAYYPEFVKDGPDRPLPSAYGATVPSFASHRAIVDRPNRPRSATARS
jgi:hypothetical protein